MTIKDGGTNRKVWKARFVVQGHRDKMKNSLVHDILVSRQYSVKILVELASSLGFQIFSTDVTQAYLQSSESLQRDIYIRPPPELSLKPDKVLKLLKPLYGLAESGDYWGRTFRNHLEKKLGMQSIVADPSFYFQKREKKLNGLCATYVDDTLHAGNKVYSESCLQKRMSFNVAIESGTTLSLQAWKLKQGRI